MRCLEQRMLLRWETSMVRLKLEMAALGILMYASFTMMIEHPAAQEADQPSNLSVPVQQSGSDRPATSNLSREDISKREEMPQSITPAIIAAIATSVSAVLALIGVLYQSGRNLKQQRLSLDEQLKAQRDNLNQQLDAQRNSLERQLHNQQEMFERQQSADHERFRIEKLHSLVEQLAVNVASGLHSICWLTWVAKQEPKAVTEEKVSSYNKEAHKFLAKVFGLQASIAALDPGKFKHVESLVRELTRLDAMIGAAGLMLTRDPDEAVKLLAMYYDEGIALEERLPEDIRKVLGP
jgi:cell division protein FtsB